MARIIVGVDGTASGDAALLWALREAAASGSAVVAVMAWQLPAYGWELAAVQSELDLDQEAKDTLDEAVKRVTAAAALDHVELSTRVIAGPAPFVLEQEAQNADLLVVGRRHDSGAARAALGSVSSAALHHAPCPVVVVPVDAPQDAVPHRVVVGVDDTEPAAAALRWAVRRALRDGAQVVPVRVRTEAKVADQAPEGLPDLARLEASELVHLTRQAREVAGSATVDVAPEIRVGDVGRKLLDVAQPGDLVVVGSRGRGRLAGWLLGSTSAFLVHRSPVPVVVVRSEP